MAIAAKKAFGARLRNIRKDAGLKYGRELAEALGWHPSKVSRIELGNQTASEEDIRAWCIACGVARQIPELIATHREIEQMWVEWKEELRGGQKRVQESATALYERTQFLRVYESFRVPGILQTLRYARGVMASTAVLFDLPSDDLDDAAEGRLSRQRLLRSSKNRFSFVLEAGALHAPMGGIDAMHEQLDFLREVVALPGVALGIIPPGRPRTVSPGEGFYCFDNVLVRNELWAGGFRTTRPEEISYFLRVFGLLHEMAVYGQHALDQIETARALLQSNAIS